jgi:hypothetical protein
MDVLPPVTELAPTWRLCIDEPAPIGRKLLLLNRIGAGVIGTYYREGEFVAWCPMPKLTPAQKARLKALNLIV